MITASTHGALSWADLSTPDIVSALAFYRQLFGWDVRATASPMGEYFVGRIGEREVCGMMQQSAELQGQPAMWTTFFYVDDIDVAVRRTETAEGDVLEAPFEIPGNAQVAVVADPTGGMLALITGPTPEAQYLSRMHGAVCWTELLTRDPAAAEGFYAMLFGWKAETQIVGRVAYTTFHLEGEEVAGMMMMPDEVPPEAPAHWAIYFAVDDCDATAARAAELGGAVLHAPTPTEGGAFAVLADPQGATFNLLEVVG